MDRRLWRFTDHVCRHCLSRLLVADNPDGTQSHKCSNCEAEAVGEHSKLCACGLKLKNGKSAGLRCTRNPNPTTEMPARIVATGL